MANDVGRPAVVTPEVLQKLEEVFALGGSDKEASFYAGISPATLYNYQNEHPEFVERKEALKEKPILKARQALVKGLDDPDRALRFLERRKRDEFAVRTENTGAEGKDLHPDNSKEIAELTKKLNDIHRGTSIESDGGPTSAVDTKA